MSVWQQTASYFRYGPTVLENNDIDKGTRVRMQVSAITYEPLTIVRRLNQPCRFRSFDRSTTGTVEGSEMPGMGLVRDGTWCGDNLVRSIILINVVSTTNQKILKFQFRSDLRQSDMHESLSA